MLKLTASLASINLKLSKDHIPPLSFILSLAFTYTGESESLFFVFTHPVFLLNLLLNTIEVMLIGYFSYWLHFGKKFSFLQAIWRSLSLFLSLQLLRMVIIDYEPEDYIETYSIVLPFGTLVLLALNYFYFLHARQLDNVSPEERHSDRAESFWLDTSSGQICIHPADIQFAHLSLHHLKIYTHREIYHSFISLKKLEGKLLQHPHFFRLNKQCLCHVQAIQHYKSMKDGRIEVHTLDQHSFMVSKNKASAFKKWIANAKQ